MTPAQAREVVRRFVKGERLPTLAYNHWKLTQKPKKPNPYTPSVGIEERRKVEEVLRAHILKLEKAAKKGKESNARP